MACHYPDPDSTEKLRQTLVSMNFKDRMGGETEFPYLRKTAFDSDADTLCSMAQGILQGEFAKGASEIIWKSIPLINGFEEKREHTLCLILEYHPQ